MQEIRDIWVYLSASPLLHLTLTLGAFVLASLIYRRLQMNPLLNPVLLSVIAIVLILRGTETGYDTYFEGAQFVHFLLGPATVALAVPLYRQFDRIKKSADNWKEDTVLREMFRAGVNPKVRSEWLDQEIPRIRSDLERFQVAEDYRQIELQADELTKQLREAEKQQAVLDFQIDGIKKMLIERPDISRDDLLALYEGLQSA